MEKLELRGYQMNGVEGLRDGFRAGHRKQILCGGCGFGKTEVGIWIMKETAAKFKRASILLDRIVLCNQSSERLDKYGYDHGVMQANHFRNRPHERIQVMSAATLEKIGSFPDLDLLIIDEAHCMRKQTMTFIDNNKHVRVIGLTATPFTKGLGKHYTNVVCPVTTAELVEMKQLVPLRVFIAKEIEMTGAKVVAGEWNQKETGERGIQITGDVVSNWVKVTHEVFGKPEKTLVFAATVEHAISLSEEFAKAGYNFISLSYKDEDDYKKDVIADFSRIDTTINGLIAVDILTKGLDVADVKIGISARPYRKSLSSHIQQMGRVMRPAFDKEYGIWIDHAGNYLRFREDWDRVYNEGVHELDDGAEKPKPEPKPKDKDAAKCPKCNAMWVGNLNACFHCGHERPRRNAVVAVAGEIAELVTGKNAKIAKVDKQEFYSHLLSIAEEKGYKIGWADHRFKEYYKHEPKGLRQIAVPSDANTLLVAKFLQSRNIAYSNIKR